MPIYSYQCTRCGAASEAIVFAGDEEPTRCEHCQGPLERTLSTPADFRQLRPRSPGKTCCGRDERCDNPPCGTDSGCCPT